MNSMAAATSPALPAFSYAQAAKGRAPATSVVQPQAESSQNTPELSSNERRVSTEWKTSTPSSEKLDFLHTTGSVDKHDGVSDDLGSKAVRDDVEINSTTKSSSDNNPSANPKQSSLPHLDSKQISESTSPSLVASVATLPREDEDSATPNGSSESWDKQSETSAAAEKLLQSGESGKDKVGDEDWVNVPTPSSYKELKAARVPIVNIWQQRKEAQEAKAKANAALRPSAPLSAPVKPKSQTQPVRNVESQVQDDETKRKPTGKLAEKGDGSLKKKHADDTKAREDGKCWFVRCKRLLLKLIHRQETVSPGKSQRAR